MKLINRAQTALEQRFKDKQHNESVLKQSNVWMQAITWGLISTTAFAMGWLILAKTEEIVVSPGTLQPIGAVKDIQMPIGGIVQQILVNDGDRVKTGEVVIRLDTEASEQKIISLRKSVELKNRQLELKEIELNNSESLKRVVVEALSEKLILEEEILQSLEQLSKIGASARLQYLQQRNAVIEVKGRIREANLDGLRKESILRQDIQRLKSEATRLNTELTDSKVTLRYQVLRAPVDGIVFNLQPKGPGYSSNRSESLMKIVPFKDLEAKVQIASSDIGFVREGMAADISIDSFPATDFGVLEGTVLHIGSDALPPDARKSRTEYVYPAKIQLKTQQLKLKNGDSLPLQPGMSLSANIKLRKVSYLQMLLGGFQSKTDSLRRL